MNSDMFSEVGLANAIKDQLRKLERYGTIKTEFHSIGEDLEIEPKKEIILFRIVQEAIQNVVKHACASCLSVTIKYSLQEIILTVFDNGKGFNIITIIKEME